jgi:hypothetical protein
VPIQPTKWVPPAPFQGVNRPEREADKSSRTSIEIKNIEHTQKNGVVSNINKKFLTLHGHNIHCQQRDLSKFLMHYQQFASHAYCGAAGPVSKMASQQEKAFCVRFELSRSVISDYSAE